MSERNSRGRRMSDGSGFWGVQPQHVPDLLSDYTGRAFLGGGAGLLIGLVAGGIGLAVSMSRPGGDASSLLESNRPVLYRSVGVGGVVGLVVGSLSACCSAGAPRRERVRRSRLRLLNSRRRAAKRLGARTSACRHHLQHHLQHDHRPSRVGHLMILAVHVQARRAARASASTRCSPSSFTTSRASRSGYGRCSRWRLSSPLRCSPSLRFISSSPSLQCYWGYEPEPGRILMAVHTNGMGHVIQARSAAAAQHRRAAQTVSRPPGRRRCASWTCSRRTASRWTRWPSAGSPRCPSRRRRSSDARCQTCASTTSATRRDARLAAQSPAVALTASSRAGALRREEGRTGLLHQRGPRHRLEDLRRAPPPPNPALCCGAPLVSPSSTSLPSGRPAGLHVRALLHPPVRRAPLCRVRQPVGLPHARHHELDAGRAQVQAAHDRHAGAALPGVAVRPAGRLHLPRQHGLHRRAHLAPLLRAEGRAARYRHGERAHISSPQCSSLASCLPRLI